MKIILAIITALFISGCDQVTPSIMDPVYIQNIKKSESPHYALYKHGNDQVAVFHGFYWDSHVCNVLATLLNNANTDKEPERLSIYDDYIAYEARPSPVNFFSCREVD